MAELFPLTSTGFDSASNHGLRHVSRFLGDDDLERMQKNWYEGRWMWVYFGDQDSKRNLTFETDRIAALSGCTWVFDEALDSEYLAGLWLDSIALCLLWE